MKRQIWLHVGPPKTGTSAIQKYLVSHRDVLAQQGLYYPAHELGPNGISSGHLHSVLSQAGDGWQVDQHKINALLAEFDASGCEQLVLSSEFFFHHIEALVSCLPGVQVLAYIRCPIETFESSYNQGVKRHGQTQPLSFSKNLHITTLNRLASAAKKLPKTRFHFRAYFAPGTQDFNLLADVAGVLNIQESPENNATNPSYCLEALKVKRWLNQFQLTHVDAALDTALQNITEGTRNYTLLPADKLGRHSKQCVTALREFHQQHRIVGAKKLLSSVRQREHRECVSQAITDDAITFIARFLSDHYPDLYQNLCNALLVQRTDAGTRRKIQLFSQFARFSVYARLSAFLKRYLPA